MSKAAENNKANWFLRFLGLKTVVRHGDGHRLYTFPWGSIWNLENKVPFLTLFVRQLDIEYLTSIEGSQFISIELMIFQYAVEIGLSGWFENRFSKLPSGNFGRHWGFLTWRNRISLCWGDNVLDLHYPWKYGWFGMSRLFCH